MKVIKNKSSIVNNTLVATLSLLLVSCSITKYIPEDEALFTGSEVKLEGVTWSKAKKFEATEGLKALTRPVPNSSLFGTHPKLYFYNLGGDPEKESFIRTWLRTKLGEPPVYFSQVDADYTSAILSNRLENEGFFNVKVTHDTISSGKKKRGVLYNVVPGEQYKIREVKYPTDTIALIQHLNKGQRRAKLQAGKAYSLDAIKSERVRFDEYLKNKGYYYFSPDNLLIQVDSTVGNHQVDLFVKVKEDTPNLAKQQYTIGDIYINTDYKLGGESFDKKNDRIYTYNGFHILDSVQKFKPSIFDRSIQMKEGEVYNRDKHNLSLNRLVNLGVFKFVRNSFVLTDSLNHKLDVYYYLTPDKPKALRLELLGKTNSASYSGAELNLNWSHKNIFKGAEVLSVSAYGGGDFQLASKGNGYNVYKVGLESSITWPRIVSPWDFSSSSSFVPKTRLTVGGEYLERSQLYTLKSLKASWGYLWKESATKEHQLDIFDGNYVSPEKVTDLYREQAQGNPSLERVVEKQLTFGPAYTFTYTNTMKQYKKHTFYYRGGVDFSGNITGLIMGASTDKGEEKSILGIPFSQYIKTEHDFRHYLKLSKTSQLISRFHGGVGVAYGNSKNMPYTKQFYVGGSNSLRAFRARTLGPGHFDPKVIDSKFIPDQSGDMVLEVNFEYRKKLFSIVHGALFVDAGNIWNLNEVPDRIGGKFSSDFYNDIAVGAGAGIRFDITFLVLRFDFAFPLRVPYGENDNGWVIKDIQFGDSRWRKDNLMFNFAIGYPF
ncbi:MAG: BamA/TamA family outer membrane protein [Flavobacteriaceae bacterium]|jgi:outer membrane protein assembly factor BamA|nr:BamA/TamA family outer membrane protein [Flavobacteriaceae bacterium]